MGFVLALVPSVVLLLGADDAKQDLKAMQGKWDVMTADRGGNEPPEEVKKNMQVTVQGNVLTLTQNKDLPEPRHIKMILELNPSTKPKSVEIKPPTPGSKQSHPGIYEIEGDTLKIAWAKAGDRPKNFEPTKDGKTTLLVLKRAK